MYGSDEAFRGHLLRVQLAKEARFALIAASLQSPVETQPAIPSGYSSRVVPHGGAILSLYLNERDNQVPYEAGVPVTLSDAESVRTTATSESIS